MSKDKSQKQSEQKQVNPKLEEQRKKAAEGTTKPLPVAKPAVTKEDKEVDEKNAKMAKKISDDLAKKKAEEEAILEEMKATKAKLDALRAKHKAEKDEVKNAKKTEREKSLAERMKKSKEIEDADAKVAKCDKDRKATEEWKLWEKAVAEREALGDLPKAKKVRAEGAGRTRSAGDLNGSEIRAMKAIADAGHALTRKELTEATGQEKGWSKILGTKEGGNGGLCDRGLLSHTQHEGEPMQYSLTKAGEEALLKASKEE